MSLIMNLLNKLFSCVVRFLHLYLQFSIKITARIDGIQPLDYLDIYSGDLVLGHPFSSDTSNRTEFYYCYDMYEHLNSNAI